MPLNPFVKQQAVESTTDVSRPVVATPIMETVKGHVFPYRGMETHGVEPTYDTHDTVDYANNERGVEVYEPDTEPDVDPIPVRIVQGTDGEEIRRARVFRAFATGTNKGTNPSNVVSAAFQARLRRRVRIKNLDAATVYIGFTAETASPMNGWPLATNEFIETDSFEAIWAISTAANEAPLAVLVEYSVTEP